MSMTHSARKVWLILRDNGIDLPYDITVERTYAGRNLKADGWAAWSTSDGWSWTMLSNGNCPTRKVAEQNGIDSGLPPWKP